MKQYKIFFFLLALAGLCACSSNEDEWGTPVNTPQRIKLIMDVALNDYGSNSGTRAENSEWPDGATIYLRFKTENGSVAGQAIYDAKAKTWDCGTYGGLLTTDRELWVEAVYFDGYCKSNVNGDVVYTDPYTAIYYTSNATYTYSANTIKLTATLSPMAGRMRFKSAGECKSLELGGLVGYTGYDVSTGTFSTTETDASISLEVDSTGYTGYVYGYYSNKSKPTMSITYTNSDRKEYLFKADMTVGSMNAGKSGWMNIPTPNKRSGWNMTYLSYREHDLVDLSLPSGLLWAKYDIGVYTKNFTEYGCYFAWGETKTKETYTSDNSMTSNLTIDDLKSKGYVDDNGILVKKYDAASAWWGGTWRMPTKEEFQELIDNCYTYRTSYTNKATNTAIFCIEFRSKKNGNSVYFPLAGYKSGSSVLGRFGKYDDIGYYWSSNPSSSWAGYMLSLNGSGSNATIDDNGRYYGRTIRAVTEP